MLAELLRVLLVLAVGQEPLVWAPLQGVTREMGLELNTQLPQVVQLLLLKVHFQMRFVVDELKLLLS